MPRFTWGIVGWAATKPRFPDTWDSAHSSEPHHPLPVLGTSGSFSIVTAIWARSGHGKDCFVS